MQTIRPGFGRLVQTIGELSLPPNLAADIQNVDVSELGSANRRKGFRRELNTAMNGKVSLLAGFDDYDGGRVMLVIDESGINRETT